MTRHPLLDHPRWPVFRQWIELQLVGRQGNRHIAVKKDAPASIKKELREVKCVCHCGNYYYPVRAFVSSPTLWVMATGPRDTHGSCNNKYPASIWIDTIVIAILSDEPHVPQLTMDISNEVTH